MANPLTQPLPANAKPRPTRWRRLLRLTERFLAVVGLLFLIYHGCFTLTVIVSGSMAPTLQGESATTGDWVLTESVTKRFRAPARWELIHFYNRDGQSVIKRVVAFPGETVAITNGWVAVNGRQLERPASLASLQYIEMGNLAHHQSVQVQRGYYVLGDDSKDSFDSRYDGEVLPEQIVGRAWLIVRPLRRAGWVNP